MHNLFPTHQAVQQQAFLQRRYEKISGFRKFVLFNTTRQKEAKSNCENGTVGSVDFLFALIHPRTATYGKLCAVKKL